MKLIYGGTIYNRIFRIYCLFVCVGAVLLFLPISLSSSWTYSAFTYSKGGSTYTFFNALFTAISAFTNTGLTTHTTSETYSLAGQIFILLLIQSGGIGFLTILVFLWHFASGSQKINVESRALMHFERGSNTEGSSLQVVKTGIYVLFITEFIGAIILTILFYFYNSTTENGAPTLKGNFWPSLWSGIFHSISGTNNAGFDILGSKSIYGYRNDWGNVLSVVLLCQSFIGGIGYPVFYDIFQVLKNKRKGRTYQLTLFTKISLFMYFAISVVAILFVFIFEIKNSESILSKTDGAWGQNTKANKLWNLIYLTFSARSAGFAGLEMSELTQKTKWLITILMFIGASPASTGGGIRTITLFLVCAKILHIVFGRTHLSVFKRSIKPQIIEEAIIVTIFAIFLIVFFSFFITQKQSPWSTRDVLFEAASAFGTTGLTTEIAKNTNTMGQLFLLILMFVGQLGISNTLLAITKARPNKKNIEYLNEEVRII